MLEQTIRFYGKPGCLTNKRQIEVLQAVGLNVEHEDILSTAWTPAQLQLFFGDLPVAEWLNPAAPDVKSGAFNTADFTTAQLLQHLCANPILIRRPLMTWKEQHWTGFSWPIISQAMGLNGEPAAVDDDIESCSRGIG